MSAIELKKVSFSYDNENEILHNVNLNIEYGTFNLLSGYSGEGKSTLMYLISGIIPHINNGFVNGQVLINGVDIKNKSLGQITKEVGVVLQNADEQILHKTVEDEIAFGLENMGVNPTNIKKQIDTVTKLMNIDTSWENKKCSGGQKQRIITASTLAMGQKIVILDEPLANLDLISAHKLMSTLKTLVKLNYAIIVIEHRLDIVLPYVDNVYALKDKTVIKIDDKEEYLKKQSIQIEDAIEKYEDKEPILSLKNVSYNVKKKTIIDDVSFDILNGSRTLLLGENGCGKTTLLRLIARLNKLSEGTITQCIDPKLPKKRGNKRFYKNVGVIYQNPDYQLFMPTVEKEIRFGAKEVEYADHIAELFGVKKLYSRHPQSLSEGQKRRVSIAAVVASNPKVLILDEPTVGQDYKGLEEMVKVLNQIHQETNNTMIVVTHDIRCAKALCDKSIWIKEGKLYKTGSKELVDDFFDSQK
jgi:energy-coupling factor transport system ATP-binding protein